MLLLPHTLAACIVGLLTVSIIGCGGGGKGPSPAPPPPPAKTCYISGGCPASNRGISPSGSTNNTGWNPDGKTCCDICSAPGTRKVNCNNPSTCGHKTGDNDWDFLVFDQIWIPQFCSALSQGHDPTLTHLPHARCQGDAVTTGLSIHGLWPNYVGGFPQCCNHVDFPQKLPTELLKSAQQSWADPTLARDSECAWCSMWAHEMMKHGSCFATDAAGYFRSALGLLEKLEKQTNAANSLLQKASQGQAIPTSELMAVYAPYSVQISCDGLDKNASGSTGVFLELRTCWNRTSAFDPSNADASQLVQIQCPDGVGASRSGPTSRSAAKGISDPCPASVRVVQSREIGAVDAGLIVS